MTIPQALQIGFCQHQSGQLAEAETTYRQILAVQPNHPDALHLLGLIAYQAGQHDVAAGLMRRAIAVNPAGVHYRVDLGNVLSAQGRLDEAIAEYRTFLECQPDTATVHANLGATLKAKGRVDEAIAAYRQALRLDPDLAQAHNNLGIVLRERGQLDEAVAAYRRAVELKPDYLEAHNNLGVTLKERGELDEAIAAFRRALPPGHEHPAIHSNLLSTLGYHPGCGAGAVAGERELWNRQFCGPLKRFILPHGNDRDPERRLRIGYVSPDFRDHVVGRNLLPLFKGHDRLGFEIVCYAGVVQPDELTEEFRQRAHQWRSTVGVGDEALAELIRQDSIDILVDLTQHSAGNRLTMFARKPAPVQASFAGYPETTGLETIEHRISDRYLEAASAEDDTGRKERVHLIDSFWCYDPCGVELEGNGLPGGESGRMTFGCLNNFCKVNACVLSLWARVLGQVADSRLVILSGVGSHRIRTIKALESEGVEAGRVDFVEHRPRREYLELYHRLDIVLDTFPYNGHTTNLDALWMGVPVVSLAGDTPVSRAGLSTMTNIGLPELVADSEDDYVRIATELAGDLPRLAELRATLRSRTEASPLMDAPRFARQVEHAYRTMWQAWCAGDFRWKTQA